MGEQVVSVERRARKIGPYTFDVTVTRVWDPEAAARIKANMLEYLLARAPEKLAERAAVARQQSEASAD